MKLLILTAATTLASPALAQNDDPATTTQNITQISAMMASEEICSLSYDQAAIAAWIEAKTPDDASVFASQLDLMTDGSKITFADQSPSERTAHCAAIEKTAKHYGFID